MKCKIIKITKEGLIVELPKGYNLPKNKKGEYITKILIHDYEFCEK